MLYVRKRGRCVVLSKFFPAMHNQQPATQKLFHCIPGPIQGDAIQPSANYGATIPDSICAKLAIEPESQTPLVFAATHLTKALAFGLIGRDGEKLFNAAVEGTDSEIVVICNREKTMARTRDVTVLSFSDKGFAVLPHMERQAVSNHPVPINQTHVELKAKDATDLMRAGLQIFSFKESFAELYGSKDAEDLGKTKDLPQGLADLVKSGKLVWENHSRGVNPNPVLAAQMGINLKPTAPAAQVKKSQGFRP